MSHEKGYQLSFDDEAAAQRPVYSDETELAIEQGTMTPGMAAADSEWPHETETPQARVEEVDETTETSIRMAEKYGGHPNDWDRRYY